MTDYLNFTAELKRKGIHLFSSLLPLSYFFYFNREQILIISCTISMFFILAEVVRFRNLKAERLFINVFHPLLRQSEIHCVTGATYFFIAATICFFFFEKSVAIASVLVMAISDSVAAIVGKAIPSVKIFEKTLAGSSAFLLTGLLIIHLMFTESGFAALIVMIPITFLELLPLKINDNLLISVSTGILLTMVVSS